MKECFGKCDRCIWKKNGGCPEWSGMDMETKEVKCTGIRCIMQHDKVDPPNCSLAESCWYRTKPITNGDLIRLMNNKELNEWYWGMLKYTQGYTDSRQALLKWLEKEI